LQFSGEEIGKTYFERAGRRTPQNREEERQKLNLRGDAGEEIEEKR